MPPKTPNELREQLEKQNEGEPPADGVDRSAEGLDLPTPKRSEFFKNLEKVSKPSQSD